MLFGVVGGGIGGLAAALALARCGHETRVLEQAPQFEEIGAGIQLGPNATAILHELGVLERLEHVSVFPERLRLMNAVSGQPITDVDLGTAFLRHYEFPYLVLHRADLLSALFDACRNCDLISLEAGREIVEIESGPDQVEVVSVNGSSYSFDGLVGADGLWSRTRRLIAGDSPIRTPHVAYRGTVTLADTPELFDLTDVLMWVGPGFHFVQYPLRGREMLNQVAVFHAQSTNGSGAADGSPEVLDERFLVACERVLRDLAHINRDRNWEMHERAPLERWSEGRVTLLGDSAHAMLQYIAQGACQAFEDAAQLGRSFERHGEDIQAAFAAYDRARTPRTARVQQAARQWGEICHLDGVAASIRDELLGARAADDYSSIDWLYGHRIGPMSASEPA